MKKLLVIGAAALTVAALAAPAYAEDTYVELNGGPTFASGNIGVSGIGSVGIGANTGYNIGGGVGTTVNFLPPEFTLGAQAFYTAQSIKNIGGIPVRAAGLALDNSTLSFMAVANYHIATQWPLGLYLGGGIGYLRKQLSATAAGISASASDGEFGYQAQAGAEWPLTDVTNLFVEYRYQGSTDWSTSLAGLGLGAASLNVGEQTHSVTIGIRYGL